MTIRLALCVEGRTEKEFVDNILSPHLERFSIYATATIVVTKHVPDGKNHTGGAVSLDRVVNDVRRLTRHFDHVSTLFDLYGFKGRHAGESADALEARLGAAVNSRNFIPYIQRYEFEALLFARPAAAETLFGADLSQALAEIANRFANPEDINDAPETAPSRRLEALFLKHRNERFRKVVDGPLLALDIGLDAIRTRCPRFNIWLTRLESLADT